MAEIKINLEKLTEKIGKLQTLKSECDSITTTEKDRVGAGQCTLLVESLRNNYKPLKEALSLLISNSIQYFNSVKESAVKADQRASEKLSK